MTVASLCAGRPVGSGAFDPLARGRSGQCRVPRTTACWLNLIPAFSRASGASGSIPDPLCRNGPKFLDIRKERRIIATVNALDPLIPAVCSSWPAFFDATRVRVVTVCVCTQPRPYLVLLRNSHGRD